MSGTLTLPRNYPPRFRPCLWSFHHPRDHGNMCEKKTFTTSLRGEDLCISSIGTKRSFGLGTSLVLFHPTVFLLGSMFLLMLGSGEPPLEASAAEVLPGTDEFTLAGDPAASMLEGMHTFLDTQIRRVRNQRIATWEKLLPRDSATTQEDREKIEAELERLRERLRHICGVRDHLAPEPKLLTRSGISQSSLLARSELVEIHEVSWPAFDDVTGEGLLLLPVGREASANVIAIPDADQDPEEIVGLAQGPSANSAWALRLAETGCRVLVPVLVSRRIQPVYRVKLTEREYIYRSAYELGRHVLGYEIQKILAGLQALRAIDGETGGSEENGRRILPLAVMGWGEGGQLALLTGAICGGNGFSWPKPAANPAWPASAWYLTEQGSSQNHNPLRLQLIAVSGFFAPREVMWQEPMDRNIFGFLKQFGCAELVALAAPAQVVIEAAPFPAVTVPAGLGGSPGKIVTPSQEEIAEEFRRAQMLTDKLKPFIPCSELPALLANNSASMPPFGDETLLAILGKLGIPTPARSAWQSRLEIFRKLDPAPRRSRQLHELERHNQWLLEESPFVRREKFPWTDTGIAKKATLEEYSQAIEPYREFFSREVIGTIDLPLADPRPRTRRWKETDAWVGYEVMLEVFEPSVFAYGILLIPKDLRPQERRPVVVCQHGLEGRPQETIEGDHRAYHDYAAKLAERGFVVFAPQNPYIFGDKFRLLQRKLNPLGCTLFSLIIPQHRQILNWLKTLPFVDGTRIAFYGLSYGGKTAMRVPAVLTDYCLSICSADFNEWVWKNAATNTRGRYSYVFTGEYEIFEFDLGSTFNYGEMAALIAPRPFMVERGHYDGVAPDETVAYEFAKVRYLYAATLGIPERCVIEWFVGPHTIHGQGTFEFLHRFLNWPVPQK